MRLRISPPLVKITDLRAWSIRSVRTCVANEHSDIEGIRAKTAL